MSRCRDAVPLRLVALLGQRQVEPDAPALVASPVLTEVDLELDAERRDRRCRDGEQTRSG